MKKYLIAFLILVLCAFEGSGIQPSEKGDVKMLRPAEFYEKLQTSKNAVIVDVRSSSEYKKSRIPNAFHAPKRAILFPFLDSLNKDQAVFVYCGMGMESGIVARMIKDKGFKEIYNLKGGFSAWKKKDMPLDKKKVHGTTND